MKRLIFGDGKVSKIIKKQSDVIIKRDECDIRDLDTIIRILHTHNPDVVINCAAKTNLEWCQENKKEAFEVNTLGPINLITACKMLGNKLVHISSGCLFDGNDKLSTEKSRPTPSVWYTWTKTWADQYMQNAGYDNYLILRPRQLISAKSHPSNMLTKFASFDSIGGIQEANSVTCIEDFSEMIDHLLSVGETGIFNCCNTFSSTLNATALSKLNISSTVSNFIGLATSLISPEYGIIPCDEGL